MRRPTLDGSADVDDPRHAVLRDLVDAAVQEDLVAVLPPAAPGGWGRVGGLTARLRPGGALQAWRLADGPVLDEAGAAVAPRDAVAALGLAGPGLGALVADLDAAGAHAEVLAAGFDAVGAAPRAGDVLAGERLAATRGRPFHPTGRAVSGWSAGEVAAMGPMRVEPLAPHWVAVSRQRLRHGPHPASSTLHRELLADAEVAGLLDLAAAAGVDGDRHQLLPVHPWQDEHVLGPAFAPEIADGDVVPLGPGPGRLHPTASLRTLVTADRPGHHLKLPLGVATLGATRLLPPRYLDNGDRAERLVLGVVAADPILAGLVGVCDEGCWAGWSTGDDEFDDRPGHLAAQVRTYPPGTFDGLAVPMAALAADRWDLLSPVLGDDDPVAVFGRVADAFAVVTLAFLRHGILPEVHGQNVVIRFGAGGEVAGFVLRDHDTVRLHAPWMAAAGVDDPGYRIRPGGRQSLTLDTAAELVGYAQTLGFEVNLYGVADALARRHGVPERAMWARLRAAVVRALDVIAPPAPVADLVRERLLDAPRWPSRSVLGPLLAQGPSASVSMPAGTGSVPNPLLDVGEPRP